MLHLREFLCDRLSGGIHTWKSLFALFFPVYFTLEKWSEMLAYFTVAQRFSHFHFRSGFLEFLRLAHWKLFSSTCVTTEWKLPTSLSCYHRGNREAVTLAPTSASGRKPASINLYWPFPTLALWLSWAWWKGLGKIISDGPQKNMVAEQPHALPGKDDTKERVVSGLGWKVRP